MISAPSVKKMRFRSSFALAKAAKLKLAASCSAAEAIRALSYRGPRAARAAPPQRHSDLSFLASSPSGASRVMLGASPSELRLRCLAAPLPRRPTLSRRALAAPFPPTWPRRCTLLGARFGLLVRAAGFSKVIDQRAARLLRRASTRRRGAGHFDVDLGLDRALAEQTHAVAARRDEARLRSASSVIASFVERSVVDRLWIRPRFTSAKSWRRCCGSRAWACACAAASGRLRSHRWWPVRAFAPLTPRPEVLPRPRTTAADLALRLCAPGSIC